MIHCTNFVWPSLSTSMCLQWQLLFICHVNTFRTSLHPLISDGVPVLVDHGTLPILARPTCSYCQLVNVPVASLCSAFFCLFSYLVALFLQQACKSTFSKHTSRFSKHALAFQPFLAVKTAPAFCAVSWAAGFQSALLNFSKICASTGRQDSWRKTHDPAEGVGFRSEIQWLALCSVMQSFQT